MSNIIVDYVDKYVSEIAPNVYEIDCNDSYELNLVNNTLRKMIIKEKQEFVDLGKKLSDRDLFLVRTMDDLPDNLTYQSFTNRGAFTKMKNPFERIMDDYGLSEEQIEENRLVCPIYRDTVHFSINGIVSNLWYTEHFTDRGVVVIEPFSNHSEKLVNINPIDSFIDVSKSDEPIKDNAIYIIDKNVYQGLSQEIKKKMVKGKLYLFDSKKYSTEDIKEGNASPLEIITDMVICQNGFLPQHTISQSYLRSESCNYDGNYYSDKEYLKMFTDLIDKLSIDMFNISYYNLNDEIKDKREVNKDEYGVSHWDTKYLDEEQTKNYNYRLDTIKRYLTYLQEKLGLSNESLEYIYNRYCRYIELNYSKESYGRKGSWRLSLVNYDDASEFIDKVTLNKFIEVTEEFNNYQKHLLNSIISKQQISEMIDVHENKIEESIKKV